MANAMMHLAPISKVMLRWKPLRKIEEAAPQHARNSSRLGDILVQRKLITPVELAQALLLRQQTGGRLGDVLIGEGLIRYYDLYNAIAEYHHLPFADLLKTPPDPSLMRLEEMDMYLRLGVVPWREENGSIVFAVSDISTQVRGWITPRYGSRARFVITSPLDIRRAVETRFEMTLEHSSRLSLWEMLPHASARVTMSAWQQKCFYALLGFTLGMVIVKPTESAFVFIAACHVFYSITMLFKASVFAQGLRAKPVSGWDEKLARLTARTLPVYTILIPMYKEAASLPGMLEAMRKLDYPPSKLDIKLLLEMDDDETLQAALTLKPRYQFEILRIPPGTPRTKPRACNYALRFSRGEFVTIFDAEDRPDPLQLKKAVYMFRTLPDDVACLQAPLNYYNTGDNLLTRFFSLEYTILFHYMLPGLSRLGIPIPLGGTSNHMALERIRALGEWDPFNVTEDADLGTRLAARGFRTAMLDSYTMEEATNRICPWLRQRSRWIKGYMQTWLVHMRHPLTLYQTLGGKSFSGFQFFVGFSSFVFLSAPLVWLLSSLGIGSMPHWLTLLTFGNLGFYLLMQWIFAMRSTLLYREHRKKMLRAAFLYPLYHILHSWASYRALWQLIFRPHYWEKTTHGVARHIDAGAMGGGLFKS